MASSMRCIYPAFHFPTVTAHKDKCSKTCLNIPLKASMKEFTKKNFLARQLLLGNIYSKFLLKKKQVFDEVAIGSRCVLFEKLRVTASGD